MRALILAIPTALATANGHAAGTLETVGARGTLASGVNTVFVLPGSTNEQNLGDYGESFDCHLGRASLIGLERGLNGLWIRGVLMYALPLR